MADSERGSFLQLRLDQICEQEEKLAELRRSKGPFDRAVRALTTNIREAYENTILENLPSSESIEQRLWRLHYSFIEEFRARLGKLKAAALAAASIPNKKKAVEQQKFERVGGQYKCFLDEATGFYHGLIAKLRAKHGNSGKLSSSSNIIEISSSNERFRRFQCVCHRCYINLGDLARYKELHLVVEGRTADWYVAANYYQQASALWPSGGNPHNQLGVLATYAGDNVQALYHYLYCLAVPVPFTTARANAKLLFEKNQRYNSQLSNSPEEDMAIDIQMAQAFESHTKSSTESHKECPLARLQRRFRVHFITLIGLLFNKAGSEELSELSKPVLREAQLLLSQDNMLITSSFILEKSNPFRNQVFSVMQLVVLLILSVHNVGPKKEKSSRNSDGPEMSYFVMQAIMFAFQFMTVILQHCSGTEEPCCSHLFPAVVVFCNWLSSYPDFVQQIQGNEECDKLQCSFGKEACMLLAKCLQQIGTAKNHDNDSIAYSEKEGHHGTEIVLWEDKELYGIVPLKYLETPEIAMKSSVSAKSGQNVPESACVMRVERLMKALTSLSSAFKLDSSELDAMASVSKSAFDWASFRASPSEKIRCSQSSGGSVKTGDGSMELKTQGPCIVQRSIEISLSSHCRKEDRIFSKARDRKSGFFGPSKLTRLPSEVSHQHKTITEGELKACNMSEGIALQQPESELCDNNLETILEEPARNLLEHRDEGTLCSVGRGALSLGDWVEAPGGGDDNLDASPPLKKRQNLSWLSQQALTHSSGEESLNPSLSFKAVFRTPILPQVPSCSNAGQPEVGEPGEKEQYIDLLGICKEADTHTTLSLNRQGSAQDPIDLDCEEKNGTELGEVRSGLDTSRSRKRKHSPHELSKGSSPDAVNHANNGNKAVPRSEDDGTKTGNDIDTEAGKPSPSATNSEEARSVDVANAQELNVSPQVTVPQSVQLPPDQEPAFGHENHMAVDGVGQHDPVIPGNSRCSKEEQNQEFASSRNSPKNGSEIVSGRGKKRKHEATTPQGMATLPSSRCQNCQGTSAGGSDSEKLHTPQKYVVHAGFSRHWKPGWCRDCQEPHPIAAPCYTPGWQPHSEGRRVKEWEYEEEYRWLDTYTHVVPPALEKLAAARRKASESFSFADFGCYFEYGASVNEAEPKDRTGHQNNEHPGG